MMKLVFFGTPDFAIPSLYALHKSKHEILAVVTVPDKPSGRGLKNTPSPVKNISKELNYSIYQPFDLKDSDFLSMLNEIDADIFVVVAYKILPQELIIIPRQGAVNLHASLLPKYRGAAPIQHAILNGENKTGVTIFQIHEKVDTGDILLQDTYKLNSDITTGEVYSELSNIGADLIVTTLNKLTDKQLIPIKQNHNKSTTAPRISSIDCLIDWDKSAEIIHNQIRAFSPKPGAYTYFDNKRIKLFNSKLNSNETSRILHPGEIKYVNQHLIVGTGSRVINIHEIQLEGKKRMPVTEFVTGFPKIKDFSFA